MFLYYFRTVLILVIPSLVLCRTVLSFLLIHLFTGDYGVVVLSPYFEVREELTPIFVVISITVFQCSKKIM